MTRTRNDGRRAKGNDDWDGTDADTWRERRRFRDRRVYETRVRAFHDESWTGPVP